jgi:hypothetical protein
MDTGKDGLQHFHSSERFAGVLTGNGTNGGGLVDGYNIFRKYGCVPFKLLPVTATMTLDEYFAPIPQNLLDLGKSFLALMGGADFCQYQWIVQGGATDVPLMAQVLPNGPLTLGIPVNDAGWNQVDPVIATGNPAHVVSCYAVTDGSVNISDNYSPYLKVLQSGYQISYVLQAIIQYIPPPPAPTLPPNPTPAEDASWLDLILAWLQNRFQGIKGRN